MQAACNNLCARMAEDCVCLTGLGDDMAGFWGQSLFEAMDGKGDLRCGNCYAIRNMASIAV
jgi:hypothetical protein